MGAPRTSLADASSRRAADRVRVGAGGAVHRAFLQAGLNLWCPSPGSGQREVRPTALCPRSRRGVPAVRTLRCVFQSPGTSTCPSRVFSRSGKHWEKACGASTNLAAFSPVRRVESGLLSRARFQDLLDVASGNHDPSRRIRSSTPTAFWASVNRREVGTRPRAGARGRSRTPNLLRWPGVPRGLVVQAHSSGCRGVWTLFRNGQIGCRYPTLMDCGERAEAVFAIRPSRIGRFTSAANDANAMSTYHIHW